MRARHERCLEAAEMFALEADRLAEFYQKRGEEMGSE